MLMDYDYYDEEDEEGPSSGTADSDLTPVRHGHRNMSGRSHIDLDGMSSIDSKLRHHRPRNRGHKLTFSSSHESSSQETSGTNDDSPISAEASVEVYHELQIISDKLKTESEILHQREKKLREREHLLSVSQDSIETITQHEVNAKLQLIVQKHEAVVADLEQQLQEKTKENKRLKESFTIIKLANDAHKKQLEELQQRHDKLEKQYTSIQARLNNLQRKQDCVAKPTEYDMSSMLQSSASEARSKERDAKLNKQHKHIAKISAGIFDTLSVLLDWISDTHLRHMVVDAGHATNTKPRLLPAEFVQEKCFRLLPIMVDLLRDITTPNKRNCVHFLQFIYWSIVHIEHNTSQQKTNMSSTLRRLGEGLFKPHTVTVRISDSSGKSTHEQDSTITPSAEEKPKDLFFCSTDLHVRFLSSILILKCLTQVDLLAHVFDVLRNDLKTDTGKELFLYYHATSIFVPYLRPVNKTFLTAAVDIYLQMSMESPHLSVFLESCGNEHWFRSIAMALRSTNTDTKLLEKLSIILQKLSKIKSNKKYFEVYTIVTVVQEMLRGAGPGGSGNVSPADSTFLAMNLKSILVNLNVMT